MKMNYSSYFFNHIPVELQFNSSDESLQFAVPSHIASVGTHSPLWHVNSNSLHSGKKWKEKSYIFQKLFKKEQTHKNSTKAKEPF